MTRPELGDLADQIYRADCREGMRALPDASVDCVVTSPPYFYKRDYGTEPLEWDDGSRRQLGFERDARRYARHLADIFDEVWRVLKPSGSAWVNLGDTYAGGKGVDPEPDWRVPKKGLCCAPWRFALEMVERGWLLRNDVVWHKPNATPDAAKDRNTVDHEYLFFFTKRGDYYFEQQLDPVGRTVSGEPIFGRNRRTVWSVKTRPSGVPHYATYPPELVAVPIRESCPRWICRECGEPREKIWERVGERGASGGERTLSGMQSPSYRRRLGDARFVEGGYTDCGCGAGFLPGVVLDPFAGVGTTMLEAARLGRRYIGYEISREYWKIARGRLSGASDNVTRFLSGAR